MVTVAPGSAERANEVELFGAPAADSAAIATTALIVAAGKRPVQIHVVVSIDGREIDHRSSVDRHEFEFSDGTVVIVEDNGRPVALVVDELLGKREVVIRSLGEMFRGVPGIAGGAILGDGRIGLILDTGGLLALAASTQAPIAV